MHPALLWQALGEDSVSCRLCNHFCTIRNGAHGLCGVRLNRNGELFTLVGDRVAAVNLDPVEKKPLFHFLPGTTTFSLGTMGCNLTCAFCQNFSLSQPPRESGRVEGQRISPEALVDQALALGAASISYTYSEPTIFYELMLPTAQLAAERGLKNIMVSNGFMSPQCLESLGPYIHAANIDLKAFTEAFYADLCGARLAPVLENLKHIMKLGWWLEVTTLVVTDANDSPAELRDMARFIHDELGPDVPWHVSRFHPCYRLTDRPPTSLAALETAYAIGREQGLRYVYLGNVPGKGGEDTLCPQCGHTVVERVGFAIRHGEPGVCSQCGERIPGQGWENLGS